MATAPTAPSRPSAPLPSKRVGVSQIQALAARVATGGEREQVEIDQPFDGSLLGTVPKCTPEDVEAAIGRARRAQEAWGATSFAERKRWLLRYHDIVLARQDELLDLVQLEAGKARRHALEEVFDAAIVARYYANTAAKHLATHRRRGALPLLTKTHELRHPLGVVAIIAPWNYPLALTSSDAVPALMAGNAVVLKPDSQTPFTALWVAAAMEDAGLPKDVLQIITGSGSELGPHLIDNSDYIMFTGSTATGRSVAERAGRNLIGASMELGGKNAMIVLEDADLDKAVEGAERALFSNAGQLCISIERLFVHEKVADAFTDKLVQRVKSMKLGTALDFGPSMGSLISRSQLDTVTEHVEDAKAKGARVLAGGRARPDLGPYFYEPTLLESVKDGMTLFRDETFGPVVAVSRFADEEEVIRRANDTEYGLNCSLWTKEDRRGRKIAARLQAGTVNVNEGYAAAWASVDAPMGGMKSSGLGRRHGAHGIQKYTEEQTIAVQRILPIAPPRPFSYGVWRRLMTLALQLLRRTPGVR